MTEYIRYAIDIDMLFSELSIDLSNVIWNILNPGF